MALFGLIPDNGWVDGSLQPRGLPMPLGTTPPIVPQQAPVPQQSGGGGILDWLGSSMGQGGGGPASMGLNRLGYLGAALQDAGDGGRGQRVAQFMERAQQAQAQQKLEAVNKAIRDAYSTGDMNKVRQALVEAAANGADISHITQAMQWGVKAPIKLGKDDRLLDPNDPTKTLVDIAPPPPDFNKPFDPRNGAPQIPYQDYEINKARAGRPQTSVNVSADRSFGTQLGENAGKILDASHAAASGGIQTLNTVAQIKGALATGKVAAGPGASAIQFFNQISGGNPEKVVATRQAIQGLAQLTLAGRAALKGQGQISDYEGKLLAKASSGDIDSMTVKEIEAIANVADRNARISIRLNRQNVDKARKAAPNNQDLVDFYDVSEPPPYAQPVAQAGAPEIKVIGGKTYHKINGQWMQE